jgi:hypothetical protein
VEAIDTEQPDVVLLDETSWGAAAAELRPAVGRVRSAQGVDVTSRAVGPRHAKAMDVEGPASRRLAGVLLVGAALLVSSACGGSSREPVDVTAACDRLEELAAAILKAQDSRSVVEFVAAVEEPEVAFVEAAAASGDQRLSELAHSYDDAFQAWRSGTGIDPRIAAGGADMALDLSGQRCIELGASNDFPGEPASR